MFLHRLKGGKDERFTFERWKSIVTCRNECNDLVTVGHACEWRTTGLTVSSYLLDGDLHILMSPSQSRKWHLQAVITSGQLEVVTFLFGLNDENLARSVEGVV